MDTPIWIGSMGSAVAGIGAAVAAVIMAVQMKRGLNQEAARHRWLRKAMLDLRSGKRVISDNELEMALYWIHQGVLDVYPPTAYPEKFLIKYRTEGM
jgi:hypothetical protein